MIYIMIFLVGLTTLMIFYALDIEAPSTFEAISISPVPDTNMWRIILERSDGQRRSYVGYIVWRKEPSYRRASLEMECYLEDLLQAELTRRMIEK